uniref:Glycoprotein n=1 Tax=Thogotovirus dhoriense TaxID=11318 RepID=A0A7M1I6Q2_9ORTO|nr:glycoprotein [Thogotovirus dhoriense]
MDYIIRTTVAMLLLSTTHQIEVCNKAQQQGPYTLTDYQEKPLNISRIQIKVVKTSVVAKGLNFHIGYRAVWRSYCYNGGSLDKNTGCYNDLVAKPPTESELRSWRQIQKCCTGPDAIDAWGSSASVCWSDWKMEFCHTAKELKKYSNNNHFAYHTCNLSWRCGFKSTHTDVRLQASGGLVSMVAVLPNGTLIPIANSKPTYWTDDSFAYLYDPTNTEKKTESTFLWCFKEHIRPMTELSGAMYDTHYLGGTYDQSPQFNYYCRDNGYYFELPANRLVCLPTSCYKREGAIVNTMHPDTWKISEKLHSASQFDVNNVVHSLVYETEGLRLALSQLDHRFATLSKLFNKLTQSLAKIDDRLLGTLLGQDVSSRFISPTRFMLSPCLSTPEGESNCHNNSIYRDGRWVHNSDPTQCFSLSKSQPVDLYSFKELWLPQLLDVNVEGVVADEEGWSFVAQSRQALIDTMTYTKNGGKGTSLEDVLGYPSGWIDGKLHGLLLNGAISWIVIVGVVLIGVCLMKRVF